MEVVHTTTGVQLDMQPETCLLPLFTMSVVIESFILFSKLLDRTFTLGGNIYFGMLENVSNLKYKIKALL